MTKCRVVMQASQGLTTRGSDPTIFIEDEVIDVSGKASTRTQVGDVAEGTAGSQQPIRWSDNDKFVAWAAPVATDGSASTNFADGFEAATFSLDHYNYTYYSADFAATIPSPMSQSNTYDYYAAFPVPSSRVGTTVTYSLPTTQSGDYDAELDIMRATVRGGALVERNPEQTSNQVWPEPTMEFEHLMHAVRIYIPEGRNLMFKGIKQLEITFPTNVVGGTVSFDAINPDSDPVWSDQTNKVLIDMSDDKLLNAGGRYVWVLLKPGVMSGEIKFRGYLLTGQPSRAISTYVTDLNLQAQHITPINLTIPEALAPIKFTFSCPDSNEYPNFLGENATKMYVKQWPAGLKPQGVDGDTMESANGTFTATYYYEEGELNTDLPGKSITVGFASNNADVSHHSMTYTLPTTLIGNSTTIFSYALPYLFYEDFAGAADNSEQDDNSDGSWLSSANLNGWSGSRWTSHNGSTGYIELNSYIGTTAGYTDVKWGRLDSPAMSRLTNNTKVTITYDINGTKSESKLFGSVISSIQTRCMFGMHSNDSAIGGGSGGTLAGADSGNRPANAIEYNTGTGGFSTSMPKTSHTMDNCSSASRFTWFLDDHVSKGAPAAVTIYMYIDNIKVSVGGTTKHTDKNYRTYFPNHQN
ncbi:MAG: hypothetical protein IKY82_02185 [Alistipes sp.]|nr:hypothetical protein [Alistipes sp.]